MIHWSLIQTNPNADRSVPNGMKVLRMWILRKKLCLSHTKSINLSAKAASGDRGRDDTVEWKLFSAHYGLCLIPRSEFACGSSFICFLVFCLSSSQSESSSWSISFPNCLLVYTFCDDESWFCCHFSEKISQGVWVMRIFNCFYIYISICKELPSV